MTDPQELRSLRARPALARIRQTLAMRLAALRLYAGHECRVPMRPLKP